MSLPKIDIPLPCGFIYQHCQIPDLVSRTSTNCMQPPWYNSNQMWISWRVPGPFQLNRHKSFKNRAEFVKDDVINHVVARTSSEWHVDRKCLAKRKYCQKSWFKNGDEMSIIWFWNSAFYFRITSHPSTKHALLLSFCCFEINRCLIFYSDKIFWSNSNMQ